jgi:hypothetical protein
MPPPEKNLPIATATATTANGVKNMVTKPNNQLPPPDFILALADVIRFIDKRRANANPPPAADDTPRPDRPPAPPVKKEKTKFNDRRSANF